MYAGVGVLVRGVRHHKKTDKNGAGSRIRPICLDYQLCECLLLCVSVFVCVCVFVGLFVWKPTSARRQSCHRNMCIHIHIHIHILTQASSHTRAHTEPKDTSQRGGPHIHVNACAQTHTHTHIHWDTRGIVCVQANAFLWASECLSFFWCLFSGMTAKSSMCVSSFMGATPHPHNHTTYTHIVCTHTHTHTYGETWAWFFFSRANSLRVWDFPCIGVHGNKRAHSRHTRKTPTHSLRKREVFALVLCPFR